MTEQTHHESSSEKPSKPAFPGAKFDKRGSCVHHPSIQLQKRRPDGWKVLLNSCPQCDLNQPTSRRNYTRSAARRTNEENRERRLARGGIDARGGAGGAGEGVDVDIPALAKSQWGRQGVETRAGRKRASKYQRDRPRAVRGGDNNSDDGDDVSSISSGGEGMERRVAATAGGGSRPLKDPFRRGHGEEKQHGSSSRPSGRSNGRDRDRDSGRPRRSGSMERAATSRASRPSHRNPSASAQPPRRSRTRSSDSLNSLESNLTGSQGSSVYAEEKAPLPPPLAHRKGGRTKSPPHRSSLRDRRGSSMERPSRRTSDRPGPGPGRRTSQTPTDELLALHQSAGPTPIDELLAPGEPKKSKRPPPPRRPSGDELDALLSPANSANSPPEKHPRPVPPPSSQDMQDKPPSGHTNRKLSLREREQQARAEGQGRPSSRSSRNLQQRQQHQHPTPADHLDDDRASSSSRSHEDAPQENNAPRGRSQGPPQEPSHPAGPRVHEFQDSDVDGEDQSSDPGHNHHGQRRRRRSVVHELEDNDDQDSYNGGGDGGPDDTDEQSTTNNTIEINKKGCCVRHTEVRLCKKKMFGKGWKVLRSSCPRCVAEGRKCNNDGGHYNSGGKNAGSKREKASSSRANSRSRGRSVERDRRRSSYPRSRSSSPGGDGPSMDPISGLLSQLGVHAEPGGLHRNSSCNSSDATPPGARDRQPTGSESGEVQRGGRRNSHRPPPPGPVGGGAIVPYTPDDDEWLDHPADRLLGPPPRNDLMIAPLNPRAQAGPVKAKRVTKMPFTDEFGEPGQYTGEVDHDGLPDGKGKMKYENGILYEGKWEHGLQCQKALEQRDRMLSGFTSWSGKNNGGGGGGGGGQTRSSGGRGGTMPWNARSADAGSRPSAKKRMMYGMSFTDIYGDSGRYTGNVNDDDMPHGPGVMRYESGLVAEGDWTNGVLNEDPFDRPAGAMAGAQSVVGGAGGTVLGGGATVLGGGGATVVRGGGGMHSVAGGPMMNPAVQMNLQRIQAMNGGGMGMMGGGMSVAPGMMMGGGMSVAPGMMMGGGGMSVAPGMMMPPPMGGGMPPMNPMMMGVPPPPPQGGGPGGGDASVYGGASMYAGHSAPPNMYGGPPPPPGPPGPAPLGDASVYGYPPPQFPPQYDP